MSSISFIWNGEAHTLTRYNNEVEEGKFQCINWDTEEPRPNFAFCFADENGVICYSLAISTDPHTYQSFVSSFTKHMGAMNSCPLATALVKWL